MLKSNIDHEDKEARAYNWVLLATFALLVFLVIQTPARIVARFLPATTQAAFSAWGGSIWFGQTNGLYKGIPVQLRWQFQPMALLGLNVGLHFEVLTAQSQMDGDWRMGFSGWTLQNVKGQMAAAEVQGLLSGWKLPDAPINIQQLSLHHHKKLWTDSKGSLLWQGGALDYVFNGQRQHVNLPPVVMTIQGQNNQLTLSLQEQQGANLASFIITDDIIESRLTQRLLTYSPDYHGVAEPDAVVVTASQPLSSL